jgi:hypothetical protein
MIHLIQSCNSISMCMSAYMSPYMSAYMENFLQILLPELRLEILWIKHMGTCIDRIQNHEYGSGDYITK